MVNYNKKEIIMIKKIFINLMEIIITLLINALVVGGICYALNYRTLSAYSDGLFYSSGIYFLLFLITISGASYGLRGNAMYSHILSINEGGREKAVNDFMDSNYKGLSFPVKMIFVTLITFLISKAI